MKKRNVITIFCLIVVLSLAACGNKDNSTEQTETNSIVELTEAVETEVIATESVEPIEEIDTTEEIDTSSNIEIDESTETEVIQTETEEIVEVTEVVAETDAPQSLELTYEDFEFAYNGYTNYIDFDVENPGNVGVQIVYETPKDAPEKTAENDTTKRGLKLGNSKERVLELYGDYDKRVVYRNMRLKYGDLVPEENYIYYLEGYEPTTFDGLYCLIITLDTNGNVLAVQYNGALSKYM